MNKYSRIRQIGEGAFGKAILVKRRENSQQYVVKEIIITKMSPKERDEARKEVAVLAQLKHPNIVSYIESFEEKGSLYIVMNYCSGGDLYGKINERRGQLFPEDQILDWFVQLCLAVKHIHDRKILHRDIKCQNIFLTHRGTVQLGDFGIAKVLTSTVQLAHTCIGTPYYLSPEIVENMPYNNKSDIWSIGCVLYELTTLKHAFEAGNMKNLVLKIIRGSYPPISPQFSYDLRGLIAQLFKRNPRDRPSVNAILRKNFVMQRVKKMLSAQDLADEFSHTVMHGHKISKAIPPAPKISADPIKAPSTPRPNSAARKYDPAAVYGVPLNSSKNRMSGEQKKRPSTPGRQLPVPGQIDWEKKKKERQDAELRRKAEMKRKEQEANEKKLKDFVEKQKVARINRAREEGWRNLLSPNQGEEAMRSPSQNSLNSPRPLPIPKANQQRNDRERGNYEVYNDYLNKLYKDKPTSPPDPRRVGGNPNQVEVVYMAAPRPVPAAGPPQFSPVPRPQFPLGPLGIPVPSAIEQAARDRYSYNMQLGGQAAHRARVVEDYIQRQRQAALNKMRAQHDLFGVYRPSSADRRTPVPAPKRGSSPKHGGGGGGNDGGLVGRNKEEQDYLEKLRQIRIQNMKDRKDIRRAALAEDASRANSPETEERRKKMELLKAQAQFAAMKRNEADQLRAELMNSPAGPAVPLTDALQALRAADRDHQQFVVKNDRKVSVVPLTDALQVVAGVLPAKESSIADSDRPKSALQMKKEGVLKRLNDKQNQKRGKWGPPASPAVPGPPEIERAKWGSPASPVISQSGEGAEADPSRGQWGDGIDLHLSKVSLEVTASAMEATGLEDGVLRLKTEFKAAVLMQSLDQQEESEASKKSASPALPETKTTPNGAAASRQSQASGQTIVITQAESGSGQQKVNQELGATSQSLPERSSTVILSREYTAGKNIPIIDETDLGRTRTGTQKEASPKIDIWRVKRDDERDRSESVQMNLTKGNFDLRNVELLRTCSEPDLTQLSRTFVSAADVPEKVNIQPLTPGTLRRHHSLDLSPLKEESNESIDEEDDFSEEEIIISPGNEDDDDGGSDGDSDGDNDADEEDEDFRNMSESMQNLLEDDEVEDKTLTSEQQSSPHDQTTDSQAITENRRVATTAKQKEEDMADGNVADHETDGNDNSSKDDEEYDVQGEKTFLALSLGLDNDNSDDETIFGDDDDNTDRFGRLEELRMELETQLGMTKLLEVYKTVEKLQEDEEGKFEDDAKLALQLLGPEKQHLFPKVFQLVMSDTAFTEG